MQIYRNFTERIEEAYDGHYAYFVDRTHSPVKAVKTHHHFNEINWWGGSLKHQGRRKSKNWWASSPTFRHLIAYWEAVADFGNEIIFARRRQCKRSFLISKTIRTKAHKRKFWSCSDHSFSYIYYTHSSFHLICFQIYQQDRCKLSGTIDNTIHN